MSDDLTDLLEPAYATYDEKGKVKPGVVCIAPVPYVMQHYYTIRPLDSDPREDEHQRYSLEERGPGALAKDGQDNWSFPFKDLNLDVDEDLALVKVKRRPVVVLSKAIAEEREADPGRFQDSFWCAPCYTLVDTFFHSQFPVEFVEDVRALTYRSCFPLPHDAFLHDREAMIRLDRTQPIVRSHLRVTERRLTPKWVLCLLEWVKFYLTGRLGTDESLTDSESIPSLLQIAREVLMDEVAKSRETTSPS